ncbi:Lcl domain-containing protein [Mesorhizobium sp. A556]
MFGFSPVMMGGKIKPPALGEFWTGQGGYYIGDILDGGVLFHLVIAPKASGQNNSVQWKTTNTATAGTSSLTNGLANLAGMEAAGLSVHPMGQFCKALTIGGKTDWYPPAKDELNVIYTNRTSIIGADAINVDATFYWSSSSISTSSTLVWLQRFDLGTFDSNNKANLFRVRAIRRVAA